MTNKTIGLSSEAKGYFNKLPSKKKRDIICIIQLLSDVPIFQALRKKGKIKLTSNFPGEPKYSIVWKELILDFHLTVENLPYVESINTIPTL